MQTYIVALFWLPQANVLRGKPNNVTLGVDHTSPSAAGADVNANIVVHVHVQFIVGVCTHLTRVLTIGTGRGSKWQVGHDDEIRPLAAGVLLVA